VRGIVYVNDINVCFVTDIANLQSDSSKGDTELQMMRKQLADEKMKKEQVKHLILNLAAISLCLLLYW